MEITILENLRWQLNTWCANDQANSNLSTVTLFNVGSLFPSTANSVTRKRLSSTLPRANPAAFWMLKTPARQSEYRPQLRCHRQPGETTNGHLLACGTFYATGSQSPATATKAYQSLAAALNAIAPDDLVFLVTVGQAGYSPNQSSWDVGHILHQPEAAPNKTLSIRSSPLLLKMWAARLKQPYRSTYREARIPRHLQRLRQLIKRACGTFGQRLH